MIIWKRKMRWNGVWNEHPGRGIYRGIGMKFVIFCNFFRIFWTPNGQKWLVATASTRGPIRSRHVDQSDRATSLSPALSPRQCLASLSPPSRPPLARAGAPARARARRHRPAPASRPPIARARAAAASSRPRCRPHWHQPNGDRLRPCLVFTDWSSGMISSKIISLIYINFYELTSERASVH
jgi:hypothetical protein